MSHQPSYDTPLEAVVIDAPETPRGGWREVVDNPWLVLGTLFFVTAALGLPVLWMSRAFSRTSKAILTVVVLLYTALLIYVFWLVMLWCYTRIADAL
jgi:hypothetical protein